MAFWTRFRNSRPWPQVALLAVGALSILAGVYRNEVATVLNKAVHICLECIGIG